ncbi:hypothetical protein AX16_007499 [Volvariella volvacea WC 439]|nr:hypothetical protein AX16_007499 [Volvariella volvacea WC 439]
MQHIEGVTLYKLWSSMSWWMKFRVALTIRYYVYQLRGLPSRLNLSQPGPIGDYDNPYCKGRLFPESGGPTRFDSYASLAFWYDECLYVQKRTTKRPSNIEIEPFDRSRPLAIVHQDLHLNNLMLGHDGQLWVLDWGMAGVYPDWFEYANMAIFAGTPMMPDSWKRLIPWMFGKFEGPGQLSFIYAISNVLNNIRPDFDDFVRVQ